MNIELLAPAGDHEKLQTAIHYGADAVYFGGENFGLRKASGNFSLEDMKRSIHEIHRSHRKAYVTLNIIPHEDDFQGLPEYIEALSEMGVDAVIVSDPGVFSVVRRIDPNLPIHISTQASLTNYEAIKFWYDLGVRRVVLARELSLFEITQICQKLPKDMELEAFVHGAMCISYSGRCILSNYMTGRDANRGDCAHACRYKYHLVEEKRPGEYFPVYEDEQGTFIMNSRDLCMIEYLPHMIQAGIRSFKIEGRVKSAYYVATIVSAYRNALDTYLKDPERYQYRKEWLEEIQKVSHREFTTGFFLGDPKSDAQIYTHSSYIRNYEFVGLIQDYDEKTGTALVEQRNRIFKGDEVEIFGPNREFFTQKIEEMLNEYDEPIEVAPHPQMILKIKTIHPVRAGDMIRRKENEQ